MDTLRAYAIVDRLQPQLAGIVAASSAGFLPISGESALLVEVAPGVLINRAIDLALKASPVRIGKSFVERHFGYMEVHAGSQQDVRFAGEAVLKGLGFSLSDRTRPTVLTAEIIQKVSPYHAQMMNIFRNGSLLLPGKDFFTMECEPAAYVFYAANEVEKRVDITMVDCNEIGAAGRLTVSGTPSEVLQAKRVAVEALENMK